MASGTEPKGPLARAGRVRGGVYMAPKARSSSMCSTQELAAPKAAVERHQGPTLLAVAGYTTGPAAAGMCMGGQEESHLPMLGGGLREDIGSWAGQWSAMCASEANGHTGNAREASWGCVRDGADTVAGRLS